MVIGRDSLQNEKAENFQDVADNSAGGVIGLGDRKGLLSRCSQRFAFNCLKLYKKTDIELVHTQFGEVINIRSQNRRKSKLF